MWITVSIQKAQRGEQVCWLHARIHDSAPRGETAEIVFGSSTSADGNQRLSAMTVEVNVSGLLFQRFAGSPFRLKCIGFRLRTVCDRMQT